ncbi:MAG: hypothetical protein VB862_02555, partial [Pirellulaceae bacterium]
MQKQIYSLALLMTLSGGFLIAQEWPQFRGPNGNGHAAADSVQTSWSEKEALTWKTALPGKGWSSPVISGDFIWMTTAVENKNGPVDLYALCVSLKSGKLIHNVKLFVQSDPEKIH